jgi:DNA polymerase III delta prime subunit
MNEQQKLWFDKLTKDRTEKANHLEDPALVGIFKAVSDINSGKAHFIYELLQNANDAGATKCLFQLDSDGLFFKHNGTQLFNISDPVTERNDSINKTLGHINSITSIANSTKTESKIGKFGIGFKSVFQYTNTPFIYDQNFSFKIERYIVPINLLEDSPFRETNETVFKFPFNKSEISPNEAHDQILAKLNQLVYPTLFLTNLKEVEWELKGRKGCYKTKCVEEKSFQGIRFKKLEIYNSDGDDSTKEMIYTFSQNVSADDQTFECTIGFFVNDDNKIIAKQRGTPSVFCFFPTVVDPKLLKFIVHAPFLLINNREAIKSGEDLNVQLVSCLAKFVSVSLLKLCEMSLIDDNIIDIIPYDISKFTDIHNSEISFTPIFDSIKRTFQENKILPAKGGGYCKREDAYWADSPDLTNLFSNEQLSMLVQNPNAKWVFSTVSKTNNKFITDYIDGGSDRNRDRRESNLIKSNIDLDNKISELITSNFIEAQSDNWLHKFYAYLYDKRTSYEKFKTKPIFKDVDGKAVAAFRQVGNELHSILFLPFENVSSSYKTIDPSFINNEKSKNFFEKFGIKRPSLKDEIYNHIIPLYHDNIEYEKNIDDAKIHFKKFISYWNTNGRPEEFIDSIKSLDFLCYNTIEEKTTIKIGKAAEIYHPTKELIDFFAVKGNTKFIDLESYSDICQNHYDDKIFNEFILKLGISFLPRIIKKGLTILPLELQLILKRSTDRNPNSEKTTDKILDGCKEIINYIDREKSILLWNFLGKLSIKELIGEHRYYARTVEYQKFDSNALLLLKNKKWLFNRKSQCVSPFEITVEDLANEYETNNELTRLLSFKTSVALSEAERIAQKFENEKEAELARELLLKHKLRQQNITVEQFRDNSKDKNIKLEDSIKDLDILQNELTQKYENTSRNNIERPSKIEIKFDEFEEYSRGVEELKKQLEIKKSRVDLIENINRNVKYSYDWFLAYLKLLTTYVDKPQSASQKTISFQTIKNYNTENKYFLLCGTSSYISNEIENAENLKVSLFLGSGKKEDINVAGVSKKGQNLLIYCPESISSNIVSQFSNIFRIEVYFTPVVDLLDKLYVAFLNQTYINRWENICCSMPPLMYIYGPPGTGKTTTICNNIKSNLLTNPKSKYLVLTPTNKAADVVCKKLKEINSEINAIRLSKPVDPDLANNGIYRDILGIEDLKDINVVVSTIHRLSYFDIQDVGFLFQYQWDHVIFDESSMTGLHYITFAIMALHKTNYSTKFIVAGDPKQIPPVIEINDKELENFDFQEENIYKMMDLESFDPEQQKIRINDQILNLTTQYRSIPHIGQLFSELSYSNKLNHYREGNYSDKKILPEKFKNLINKNVNFINVPLNTDDSIFKVSKLFYSSYHIYSAILVSEILNYFKSVNNNEHWTIGVIAPYKAQALLLNKLVTSFGISEKVKVYSDTVHGFQGDECDIVFFICNPNNYYYTRHEKALLSKEYIYNVAISRARDYLVILHPYTDIQDNDYINIISQSYLNNFGDNNILNAKDLEETLFKDEKFIEKNCIVSGHETINVFGLSDMRYVIKTSDIAIDIQLHLTENNS